MVNIRNNKFDHGTERGTDHGTDLYKISYTSYMIVTHFDTNFYDWGYLYLKSLNKYNPELKVYISGVNLTEIQIQNLNNVHSNVYIINHHIDFNGVQERRDGDGEDARWKIMMQCRVSQVILDAIEYAKNNDIYMLYVTNADMLVNQNITEFIKLSEQYDVMLLEDDDDHLQRKQIMNGILTVNLKNPTSIEFCKEYNLIHFNRQAQWFDDQIYLMNAYTNFQNKLNIGRIQKNMYCDGFFNKKSYIWSGHVGNKGKNLRKFKKR